MAATRSIVIAMTSLALVAACGGGDDDSDPGAEPASEVTAAAGSDAETGDAAEPATDAATESTADGSGADPASDDDAAETDDAPAPAGGGDNVAIVTIGDATYEIDVTPGSIQRCDPDFFGAFWALGGDADVGIELLLPPSGDPNFEEPPSVKVGVTDGDREWIADSSRDMFGVEEGESQVDGFTVDGSSVSGTATFIDLNETYSFQGGLGDEPVPVPGSFSVSCSG